MFQHLQFRQYCGNHPLTGKDTWAFSIVDDDFTREIVAEDTGQLTDDGRPVAGTIEPMMQLYESRGLPVPLNYVLYKKAVSPFSTGSTPDFPLWHKYKDEIKRLKEADAKAPVGQKLGDRVSLKGPLFEGTEGRIVDYTENGYPIWEQKTAGGPYRVIISHPGMLYSQSNIATTTEEKEDTEMNPFKVGDLVSKRNGTDRIDGVVKWVTCFGATASGSNVCSHKKCRHSPKDYVWVEWKDGKLYSYQSNELMSSDDKMIQMEQEKALSKKKDVEEKEETAQEQVKEGFLDRTKKEGSEAAYRICGTQMTKGVRTGICAALAKKGQSSEKIAAINEFLEGEFGAALISYGLGLGLEKIPGIGDDKRVKKLSKEFRIQGFEKVGNELIGTAMEHVLPAITTALAALPKEETTTSKKTRVVHKEETNHEEHEQEEQETSLAKVLRA